MAVIEVAFRLALADSKENALPYSIAFLGIDHKIDPQQEMLNRLADTNIELWPVSSARKRKSKEWPWPDYQYCEKSDRQCKKKGILIFAGIYSYDNENTVRVSYGWEQARLAMAIQTATLKRIDGKWVFHETGIRVMS